jgi:hypothetical protein
MPSERLRRSLCDLPSTRASAGQWAHIVVDADEQLGQPIVSNGPPLTKLHHAAFDAHLIGINPISESMSPIGYSKSMMAHFSNSG